MCPRSWITAGLLALVSCGPTPRSPELGTPDAVPACADGATRCDGQTFSVCANGEFVVIEDCPITCTLGGCSSCPPGEPCVSDACAQAGIDKSYIGCEYWAVDLANALEVHGPPIPVAGMECAVYPQTKLIANVSVCEAGGQYAGRCEPGGTCPSGYTCTTPSAVCGLDAEHAPFAVVVSNPSSSIVGVTIANAQGFSTSVSVDPGAIRALFPQQLGFPDQSIVGSGKHLAAYKLTSTAPIVAYQFNPLDDVDVFSNDASLLIPRAGFADHYVATSYTTLTRRPQRDDYNGFVSIVAWEDDTTITISPTANTVGGADGTPALVTGQPAVFTLRAFEVLNLEGAAGPDAFGNDGLNGGDLTGTVIQTAANKTVGVFGGHEAVRISAPNSNCCADHLEEMLFPTTTWGKQFAIHRTLPRRDAPDALRIVATSSNTLVTITPPPVSGTCPVLGAGAYCDVLIAQPTEVVASQPVSVAHLMLSAISGMDGIGDPSLGLVPPIEQHRTDYKFLAPMDYAEQYVNIVAVQGDQVTLDGQPVTSFQSFGTARMAATVPIGVGSHIVSCPLKCSVEVYGWSLAVSYLFAGGLDLKPLVLQ